MHYPGLVSGRVKKSKFKHDKEKVNFGRAFQSSCRQRNHWVKRLRYGTLRLDRKCPRGGGRMCALLICQTATLPKTKRWPRTPQSHTPPFARRTQSAQLRCRKAGQSQRAPRKDHFRSRLVTSGHIWSHLVISNPVSHLRLRSFPWGHRNLRSLPRIKVYAISRIPAQAGRCRNPGARPSPMTKAPKHAKSRQQVASHIWSHLVSVATPAEPRAVRNSFWGRNSTCVSYYPARLLKVV